MSKNKKDDFNQESTPQSDQLLPENTVADNEATVIIPETDNLGEAAAETVQLDSLSPEDNDNISTVILDHSSDSPVDTPINAPEVTPEDTVTAKTPKVKAAKDKLGNIRKAITWKSALVVSLCTVAAFGVGILGGISLHHDRPQVAAGQEARAPHGHGFLKGADPKCDSTEDCQPGLRAKRPEFNPNDSQNAPGSEKDKSASKDKNTEQSSSDSQNSTEKNSATPKDSSGTNPVPAEELKKQYQELEKRLAELEKQSKNTNQ